MFDRHTDRWWRKEAQAGYWRIYVKIFFGIQLILVILELSKLIEICVTDRNRMILKTDLVTDSKL